MLTDLHFKTFFMESVLHTNNSLAAQEHLLAYLATHDVMYITEDAVFRDLSTGKVYTGRAEIGAMLHYLYHVAFEAKAEMLNYMITENKAMVEGLFKGKHIGDINGIAATGRMVNVPICVTYLLKDALIQEAHIYLLTDVLLRQLTEDNS